MTEELWNIVSEYRMKGVWISDGEVENIFNYCMKKMDVAKIQNKEEYLPLLFRDEVKSYLFRYLINVTTILKRMEAEGICVAYV